MDITKQYIKMCEKAEEIQSSYFGGREIISRENPIMANWVDNFESGDFIFCRKNKRVVVLYFNEHHGNPPEKYTNKKWAIWLPRQDQLQEMVFDKDTPYNTIIQRFMYDWLKQTNYEGFTATFYVKSMEQLWLAFVMKKRFNKIWNGEDWITEK